MFWLATIFAILNGNLYSVRTITANLKLVVRGFLEKGIK